MAGDEFVSALRAFDSHERGILLQWATGLDFELSAAMREEFGDLLGLPVPWRAYVAMDYTLDWLYAAMRQYLKPRRAPSLPPPVATSSSVLRSGYARLLSGLACAVIPQSPA